MIDAFGEILRAPFSPPHLSACLNGKKAVVLCNLRCLVFDKTKRRIYEGGGSTDLGIL